MSRATDLQAAIQAFDGVTKQMAVVLEQMVAVQEEWADLIGRRMLKNPPRRRLVRAIERTQIHPGAHSRLRLHMNMRGLRVYPYCPACKNETVHSFISPGSPGDRFRYFCPNCGAAWRRVSLWGPK